MIKKLALPLLMSAVALSACQSKPTAPVIQRPNNVYETTGLGKTKIIAQQNAVKNAKQQCGRYNPVVIKDTTKYNGVIDEGTGRVIDQVGTVIGGILGKATPKIARDDDYEYTISFRCE